MKQLEVPNTCADVEIERVTAQLQRMERGKSSPGFELMDDALVSKHEDATANYLGLCESTASGSQAFQSMVISQLSALGVTSTDSINACLGFLRGLEPKDELETMLMLQMFVTNKMVMAFSARALTQSDPELADRNVNRVSKLMNRFAEHMGTLNKHRGKGQQKVTVEHVTVNSGGQAIVGVAGGGGTNGKA